MDFFVPYAADFKVVMDTFVPLFKLHWKFLVFSAVKRI